MNDWMEKRREARRPVEEAGGGESEGFEQAEQELIERAENWEGRSPEHDAFPPEEQSGAVYGEADHERGSEDGVGTPALPAGAPYASTRTPVRGGVTGSTAAFGAVKSGFESLPRSLGPA